MANDASVERLRVGEVAAATGLTVRTLHHYEAVGLVVPNGRSSAGYRLYDSKTLDRLYHVSMLRALGLSLPQIRAVVDGGPPKLRTALAAHLTMVDDHAAAQQRLRSRLAALIERLDSQGIESCELLELLRDTVQLNPTLERRISILVYADLAAAYQYLVEVFGFGPGELTRYDNATVRHAIVHAGDGDVWLHPESEAFALASPRRLGSATATMAVLVDDVDEHYRAAKAKGAEITYEPVDQPYGFREYSAIDLEGHVWSFMRPLE